MYGWVVPAYTLAKDNDSRKVGLEVDLGVSAEDFVTRDAPCACKVRLSKG